MLVGKEIQIQEQTLWWAVLITLCLPCHSLISLVKGNVEFDSNASLGLNSGSQVLQGSEGIRYSLSEDRSTEDNITERVKSLSLFLERFTSSELGLVEAKNLFESTSFDVRQTQGLEHQIKSLASNFSSQIYSYVESIERLVELVKLLYLYNETLSPIDNCCDLDPSTFVYDAQYKSAVRMDAACWSVASKSKLGLFVPSIFSQAMVKNFIKLPYLRWQYFISPDGVYVEYPANRHNCNSSPDGPRRVFSPKTHPERKMWLIQKAKENTRIHRIVFLIQLGKNPSVEVIKSVKSIVLMMLRFLDEADEVGLLNANPEDSDFLCERLVPVTPWTRYQILSYLNFIENHHKMQTPTAKPIAGNMELGVDSIALSKSVRMACANFSSVRFPPSAATIIHLHSGQNLNKTLFTGLNSPCPIFIESYILQNLKSDELSLFKAQLQASHSKNVWNIQVQSMAQMEPESFAIKIAFKLNSKKNGWSLSDILSQFFPEAEKRSLSGAEFSLPHWNPVSKEPVIVVKKYVFSNDHPLGLVAAEIPLVHFTQHVTYYMNENACDANNYAFLIDIKGRVIAHPALGRPDISEEVLSPIQIEQVEVYQGFSGLKKRLVSDDEPTGCQSLRIKTSNDWSTYAWFRVKEYVLVIVAFGSSGGCFPYREEKILRKSTLSPKSDLKHHLLLEPKHCCSQDLNLVKGALYLSPSAFSKPAASLNPSLSIKVGLSLMAFLSDNSGLLQNQNKGLKISVKHHIGVLSNILPIWKNRMLKSPWTQYIQKRFAAGGGGTFMILYPGIPVGVGYVPHSSTWFRKGVNGNGKIMFTSPEVNSAGTPSSSMSILVKAGEPNSTVSVAVIGATVSIGFFQKLLAENIPDCEKRLDRMSIRCLLMDEEGYVIFHPNLANALLTSTRVHLTQIEPMSAIDILQSGPNATAVPLQKHICHKLSDTSATQESLQRFYSVSVSHDKIQKFKYGEPCNRYRIHPIRKTNLFLVVIHDNCSSAAAFCPCSTVDNLCLNCLRIEMTDCECPCECPREPNFCATQGFKDLPGNIEPCVFPPEPLHLDGAFPPCGNRSGCEFSNPCEGIQRKESCIGVGNCAWCESLKWASPRCTTYELCYGFLEGRRGIEEGKALQTVPSTDDSVFSDGKRETASQITMVPILSVLSVFLVFLAVVFYCYRHRALRSGSSSPDVHLLPLQESPMGSIVPQAGSSRSNSDTEAENPVPVLYMQRFGGGVPPHSPPGSVLTESDNGYSTMTHNDDPCSEAGASASLLYSLPSSILPMNRVTTTATTHLPPLSAQPTFPLSLEEMTQ